MTSKLRRIWPLALAAAAAAVYGLLRARRAREAAAPSVVTRDELWELIVSGRLDNEHAARGFALVDVLHPRYFEAEHIPGAINIPLGEEDEFERRFNKRKEIIVYDASLQGDASSTTAARLRERGFTRVRDFEGGLDDWRAAYETSAALPASHQSSSSTAT